MFDKFINKYIVKGTILCETAIHIGASESSLKPVSVDNPVVKDYFGNPLIPGSSLKGVMRSFLERLLRGQGEEVCTITKTCLDDFKGNRKNTILDELKREKDDIEKHLAQYIEDNTCIICKIFGSGFNSAKLMVRDAKVVQDTFVGYEVRNGVSIDRDKNISAKGHLYEFEVVPAGTKFEFEIIAENVTKEEWQKIMIVIKAMEESMISIGGQSTRGLGKVKLTDLKLQKIDGKSLIKSIFNGVKEISMEEEWNQLLKEGAMNV